MLIVAQATLGLMMPALYRDPDWIKATWFGNDWITLLVVAPLMVWARRAARLQLLPLRRRVECLSAAVRRHSGHRDSHARSDALPHRSGGGRAIGAVRHASATGRGCLIFLASGESAHVGIRDCGRCERAGRALRDSSRVNLAPTKDEQ
jgi:hypothetical protein